VKVFKSLKSCAGFWRGATIKDNGAVDNRCEAKRAAAHQENQLIKK